MSVTDCAVCGRTMLAPGEDTYQVEEVGIHATCCEPNNLAAAWAEAEAALPEGWSLDLSRSAGGDCLVSASLRIDGLTSRVSKGHGPTPAAALRALAAKLRERAG